MDLTSNLDDHLKLERMAKVAESFSPSAPIERRKFAGRVPQLNDAINACMQRGQHVIIFGERGAGKTSLANTLAQLLGSRFTTPACGSINCDQTTTFASLWRAVFAEIPVSRAAPAIGLKTAPGVEGTLAQFLPEVVTPDAVRSVLQRRERLLIIIDEIDRIADKATTTLLADTIKSLSDHAVDVTLVLVGVAESVDALIAEHESVQRALIQVQLPRMPADELGEIVDNRLKAVGMAILPAARQRIVKLSQGLPHYTHLLGMHAAHSAIHHNRHHVNLEDTHYALGQALKHAQQSIGRDYQRAVASSRETRYPQVLLACALADTDEHGYFTAADVVNPLQAILEQRCEPNTFAPHLNALTGERRGFALQRFGAPRAYKYKFRSAILRPYIIMNALDTGLLAEDRMTEITAGVKFEYSAPPAAATQPAAAAPVESAGAIDVPPQVVASVGATVNPAPL